MGLAVVGVDPPLPSLPPEPEPLPPLCGLVVGVVPGTLFGAVGAPPVVGVADPTPVGTVPPVGNEIEVEVVLGTVVVGATDVEVGAR